MKALPRVGGTSTKLRPAWRAVLALPTEKYSEAAPARSTQWRAEVSMNCRRKRMNIVSVGRRSPGIDPRMPTVLR